MLDFQRPEWDWDHELKRVTKFRDNAIDEMAKLIPNLLPSSADSDVPDYFGGAVHRTGEACYDALVAGDVERFNTLFRPYFLGVLGAFDQVRPQVVEWEPSTAITWMSEPIIDLFEISGYAYIFAELNSKPELWLGCKEVWDTYLTRDTDQRLTFIAGISYHYKTLLGVLTPRADLRGRREMRLGDILRDLPRSESSDPFSDPPVEHPSALIRAIAPRHEITMLTADAIDVFIVKYLVTLPSATGLDFGMSQADINEINRDIGEAA